MQTKFLSTLMAAFVAVVLLASCSKTNKQGLYVPKTAAIVVHVNGESFSSKLSWEEIKKSEMFTNMYNDTNVSAIMKSALDNPENTGVDVKKDFLFFLQKDSLGGYAAFEGTVKDAAKFKQFNVDANKGATESEKDGVHFLVKEKNTISWNNDRFIILIDIPEMNELSKMNNRYSMDTMPMNTPVVYRNGVAAAGALYTLKEDNSLAKNEKFSEMINTKGDVHMWFNGETFSNAISGASMLGMVNMAKLSEGSIVATTANFENGKIVADIKSYSGKELTDIWKKYSGDKISSEMIKRIPSKDVAAIFALNFKPEGIREFIKLTGLEGFANMGAGYLGLTVDDFIKANKGDILFSVTDLKKDSNGIPNTNFIFATSIGDKAAFGKLVAAGKKIGEEKMGSMGAPVSYNSNEKYFAIGNNKESIDKYIATENNSSPDFFDKISGTPAGGYVNFQYIMNALKSDMTKDSLGDAMFQASIKMWDNLVVKGGEFKDGGVTQHIEVNLVDKSTNSLKQLNSYFGALAEIDKKRKAQMSANWDTDMPATVDSVAVAVPSK